MKRALLVVLASCGPSPRPVVAPPPSSPITILDTAPAGALELQVRVIRWSCAVTWPDGLVDSELRVPTGRAVRLVLHDSDSSELDTALAGITLHLEPGMVKTVALRIDRPGTYTWKCPVQQPEKFPPHAEAITATLPSEYEAYHALRVQKLHPVTTRDKIALGKDVFEKKGCIACHTVDGSPRVGISMAGIWGKPAPLFDGTTRTVDAAFITDALNMPTKIRRDGYPPTMPSFEGQIRDTEREALTVYIESLK